MSQWVKLSALRITLHDKQVEGKLRSKFTRWPPSWIWAFQVIGPPQLLRVSLTIVYACQVHVLESLKMASSADEGPPKKVPKWRFCQEWKKEFLWLHFDEEKEKMFWTVCKKAKRKNPFASHWWMHQFPTFNAHKACSEEWPQSYG